MLVATEVANAQLELLNSMSQQILRDIRMLELELEALRVTNAQALEALTRGQKIDEVSNDLTMAGARWLESYSLMNIAGAEMKVNDLKEEVRRKQEALQTDIPEALIIERTSLAKENTQLKETNESLRRELKELKAETEHEKVELRAKIKSMKTKYLHTISLWPHIFPSPLSDSFHLKSLFLSQFPRELIKSFLQRDTFIPELMVLHLVVTRAFHLRLRWLFFLLFLFWLSRVTRAKSTSLSVPILVHSVLLC